MPDAFDDTSPRATQNPTIRVPPHNLAAEESLLGAMLLSRAAIDAGSQILSGDDFYKPAHGHIFDSIVSLHSDGHPVDPVTVAEHLNRRGLLDGIGGPSSLVSLQANTPATSNAGRYATIIEEHAILRKLIKVAGEITDSGYELPDDVGAAIDTAEAAIFNVAERRVTDTTLTSSDVMAGALERIEVLVDHGEKITGLATGYRDLDLTMSGLQNNSLVIVGARPSMGKTSFALGAVAQAALVARRPALFFSLEMGHTELAHRLLSSEGRVNATRLKNASLRNSDWLKLTGAVRRVAGAPLYIDDNPNLSIMEIRAKARRLKSKLGDLGIVVVDYLQLMTGSGGENRQIEISEISRGLKVMARELEIPVVALSQLSRGLEMRSDKRPMLSDLRDSGSIEQDADVVMFIYRDEIYNADTEDKGTAEIIVAKHRNGPTGMTRLAFQGEFTRFANIAAG